MSFRKSLHGVKGSLVLAALTVLMAVSSLPAAPRPNPQEDACVKECINSPECNQFKDEIVDGSVSATYCLAAALYNCTLKNCPLSEEQRKEYRRLRDENIENARKMGRDCGLELAD
jgi:hypothetical protein